MHPVNDILFPILSFDPFNISFIPFQFQMEMTWKRLVTLMCVLNVLTHQFMIIAYQFDVLISQLWKMFFFLIVDFHFALFLLSVTLVLEKHLNPSRLPQPFNTN